MKILIACEYSGVVRDAFAKRDHHTISCDILPSDSREGNHYQGDVTDILYEDWDMIIAHPPCTYLSNSGVSWLYKDLARWDKLDEGAAFFKLFIDHPCKKICIENPIPHRFALMRWGNIKYDQIIQPYQFGHPESKKTCLWLKGLPLLQPTKDVKREFDSLPKSQQQRLHYLGPSKDRAKIRSKTFEGVANAMASQWG